MSQPKYTVEEISPSGSLPDGRYHTCPKYGPQVFMPSREIEVNGKVVQLVEDRVHRFTFHEWFDVNNLVTLETV